MSLSRSIPSSSDEHSSMPSMMMRHSLGFSAERRGRRIKFSHCASRDPSVSISGCSESDARMALIAVADVEGEVRIWWTIVGMSFLVLFNSGFVLSRKKVPTSVQNVQT